MQPEDRKEFNALLVATMAVYERQITAALADIFFAAVRGYSLEQVRDGLSRHLQDPADGKYSPKPADVIRQILGARAEDHRPGKDQAWSIALTSLDESETVLTTPEILAALDAARPLLGIRDKVAARLAFVEVYERQVANARREGRPVEVVVSLGSDKDRRHIAIEQGLRTGMLTQAQAEPHLIRIGHETQPVTVEGSAIAGLLAAPQGVTTMATEERQRRLAEVRAQIGIGARGVQAERSMAEALERRAETERRKNALRDQIKEKSDDSCGDTASQ